MLGDKRPRTEIFFEREALAADAPPTKKMLIGPYHRIHEMEIKILSEARVKKITDRIGGTNLCEDTNRRHALDYFVDGSLEMRRKGEAHNIPRAEPRMGGYSVVSQIDSDEHYGQISEAFLVPKVYSIMQVEKMGATEALAAALKAVKDSNGKRDGSLVRIFMDSQACLYQWEQGISPVEYTGEYDRDITRPIDEAAVEPWAGLKQHGCDIIVYWLPRNSTLEHDYADRLSFAAWKGNCHGRPVKLATRREQTLGLDEKVEDAAKKFHENEMLVWGFSTMNI